MSDHFNRNIRNGIIQSFHYIAAAQFCMKPCRDRSSVSANASERGDTRSLWLRQVCFFILHTRWCEGTKRKNIQWAEVWNARRRITRPAQNNRKLYVLPRWAEKHLGMRITSDPKHKHKGRTGFHSCENSSTEMGGWWGGVTGCCILLL